MSKLRTILYITSYEDASKIEDAKKILNLDFIIERQKGEEMEINGEKKDRPNLSSCLAFEIEKEEIKHINEGLKPMVEKIKYFKEEFRILQTLKFDISICLVITIKEFFVPVIALDLFTIEVLNDLGCRVVFDIYWE